MTAIRGDEDMMAESAWTSREGDFSLYLITVCFMLLLSITST
jgi:hypothetical protein